MFLFYVHEHIRQILQTNFVSYFKNNTSKSVTFTVLLVHSYIFQQNNSVNMSEFIAQCSLFSLQHLGVAQQLISAALADC